MTVAVKNKDILNAITCHSPLPEHEVIEEIVQICRRRIFRGFYRQNADDIGYMQYLLRNQLLRVFDKKEKNSSEIDGIVDMFTTSLPEIQEKLAEDVEATYNGDPAAESCDEVVLCYPGIYAVTNYRIAHCLDGLGVRVIPRMIAEQAHSKTGIDIHPSAAIGRRFMIDHGTGVVIGATSIIGDDVRIYQGVTLGAKSFPLDEYGNPMKGVPRHPHVGNGVIIYANATVLGTVNIGDNAVIGGNLWVTSDVPAGATLVQSTSEQNYIIK